MAGYGDVSLELDSDCKVYVGNLDAKVTKEDLEYEFERIGPIKNIWMAHNPSGFAFVRFDDPRNAEDAVCHLDGIELCGSRIHVDRCRPRRHRRERPPQRSRRQQPRSPQRYRSATRRSGRRNYQSRSPLRKNSPSRTSRRNAKHAPSVSPKKIDVVKPHN